MKNALASFALLFAAIAPTLHAADEDVAGFVRLSETPATDNLAWDDPNRFTDIPLLEDVAFSGFVEAAAGDVITAQGAFWRPQQFAYAAGVQPRNFEVEVVDGAAAGTRFNITANSGNTITVDLSGGSLAGIANGDKICISSKWTLNLLFPNGGDLTASTAVTRGTEVILPTDTPSGADFTGAPIFVYRSDLGRWIDDSAPGVDVGDQLIPAGALLVIRQNSASPLRPAFSGYRAGGAAPFKATINFIQAGLDNFANAHVIAGEGSVTADTSGANGEAGEPQHGGNATPASVWFRYDATLAGTVTIRSEFSSFDTILAAYSGNSVGSLTLLSANDDAPDATWSETTFTVAAGQSYYVALDGKAGATGTGVLGFEFSESVDHPEIVVEQPAATGLVDGVSAVGFGNVNAGATAQRVFTIRNTGTANLTGLAASWDGNAAGRFTTGAFGATTLAPGASTTLTVTFAPVAAGNESGTLRIASNDADENPFDVSITGTGVASEIVVEQPANNGLTDGVSDVNFGGVNVGVAAPLAFTIRNTGNAALNGLAASVDGTNSADFVAGALGATTLNPGQSTTVTLTFTPAAAGPRTAALHIANNDPNENPFDIALSGTGAMPEIAIEQPLNTGLVDGTSTINFGDVDGLDDAARTFTIRNLGNGPLTGLALNVDGTNASEFVAANLSSTTIAPNATATFTVTFTPTAAGTRTAAIHVTSNDADESPFDVNLTGRGIDPEISVEEPATNVLVDAGAARDYGSSNVGVGVNKTFTIKNLGTADLTGLAATFAGTHPADFSA
ncbi:MAG: TIGR02597 family protein, partial [Verrucomicrobiota bacterium]